VPSCDADLSRIYLNAKTKSQNGLYTLFEIWLLIIGALK
jgi:hypothetical protein